MAAATAFTPGTNNGFTRPANPRRAGRKEKNAAGRRAVIVDGSLQVGDTSRGGLKTSPSWSPAYLLAALEWAEDSSDGGSNKSSTSSNSSGHRKPGGSRGGRGGVSNLRTCVSNTDGRRPEAHVAPRELQLARKTAANIYLGPRRAIDDVNNWKVARPGPSALPEKLVFPSRRTPASFLPTPSSISLDSAVKPVPSSLSPQPTTRSASPGPWSRNRSHYPHYPQQQQQQQLRPRQRQQQQQSGREDVAGGAPRRWYDHSEADVWADDTAQRGAETDRIFLGDKRAMYQSMQPSAAMPPSSQPQGPAREPFGFFSLGRKKSVASSNSPRSTLTKRSRALPTSSTTSTSSATDPHGAESRPSLSLEPVADMPRTSETQNPGAKSVGVRCKGITVPLQVTKQTTTDDLILQCTQALQTLKRSVNPDTCVAIEPCLRPGLERRLRRYERVWDVVNAWDPGSPNTLIVLPDSTDSDGELSLSSVPKTQEEPDGFVLPLYHCQRQGKWSQRYITLKENGQMFASKKQDAKPSDKDVARLCHLSDFDIYLPTEAEMRKQLKPPKRYCYAVRSQERASLFVDSDHYVHFFCTEDPNVARKFRSSVHGWRSWYLVNKKLRLHDTPEPPLPMSPTSQSRAAYGYRGRASIDQGSRGRASIDLAPSTRSIGSSHGETPPDTSPRSVIPPVPPLPTALLERNAAVFAANGLLGNAYEERKQQAMRKDSVAQQQRGRAMSTAADAAFTDGPNLLNSRAAAAVPPVDSPPRTAGSDRNHTTPPKPSSPEQGGSWFPSAIQHSAGQRSTRPAALPTRRPSTASRAPSIRDRAPPVPQHHHYPLSPPASSLPFLLQQQQQQQLQQQLLQQQQQQQQPQYQQPHPLQPQPLIDLTPTFVEPPQWSRENRGRGVRAPQGKPLVDLATGPTLPPLLSSARFLKEGQPPPRSLVRRPDTGYGGGQNQGQGLVGGIGGSNGGNGEVVLGGLLASVGSGSASGTGLARRNTVRSAASSGAGTGVVGKPRAGTGPGPVPAPATGLVSSSAAAAAYMQSRGRAMGIGEAERERVRERLRSVEGRGRQGQQQAR